MSVGLPRRAPHGARGLKLCEADEAEGFCASRPAWGAWIEIHGGNGRRDHHGGRAPHGARGLKLHEGCKGTDFELVAPRMGRVD